MTEVPPYLSKGDTIGIICPAGYMSFERAEQCIQTLNSWGFKVKIGKTLGGNSTNYFSGTDEERIADLEEMLDDYSVRAIFCARGGYGISRIIDAIRFKKFRKHPKWIIGFSDVTILHAHICTNFEISSIHAPMAGAFNEGENEYILSLRDALTGKKAKYVIGRHPYNKEGMASGELVGGNLALLAHIVGTSSDIKTKNRILFLEDVGEYVYNIDRMLYQLKRNGKFNKLAGLIIGGFTDIKDTERPFGKLVEEVIYDVFKEFDYPISFGFPVSHEKENYALKIGVPHTLSISANKVVLQED
jgi:muramoyltetrapeptide carboxypeptidase